MSSENGQSGDEPARAGRGGGRAGDAAAGRGARAGEETTGDGRGAGDGAGEQLALIRETVRRTKAPKAKPRTWRGAPLARERPVARVLVDKGPVHLDKLWDYAVPAELDAAAQPGVRVRVRFGAGTGQVRGGRREGGGLLDGYILDRVAESDYQGPLAAIAQVLSPELALRPELLTVCRMVADRYAGSLADVLQLAVPQRHARVEAQPSPAPLPPPAPPEPGSWARYPHGPSFLRALARGDAPRAVWTALPGPDWPMELARAMAATLAAGRGALAVLPDGRSAARVDAALSELLGPGQHVLLTADSGPEERYRRWLAINRGALRAVVGTRAAMFAPVHRLGLVAIWEDGDSNHSERHAPQPHAREVLLLRSAHERTAFLLGSVSRTVEAAQLVETRWALPLAAEREVARGVAPLIRTVGDEQLGRDAGARAARLPSLAWQTAREGLRHGPVLVQVPRWGYVPRLACASCRTPARCGRCQGPVQAPAAGAALCCGWCGTEVPDWHCAECGGRRTRAQVVGAQRTAEELGRAFPEVPVLASGRDHIRESVPDRPALVVATPGAEPLAPGPGYAAALLLDGWALLSRPDLRASEEALRRWLTAAALVRGQDVGGVVTIVAEPTLRPVQALVRWDPAGHAARELGERAELGFPPVSRMAAVSGPPAAVAGLLRLVELPDTAEVLGPVPAADPRPGPARAAGAEPSAPRLGAPEEPGGWERALIRVRPGQGAALASALKAAQAQRLTRKQGDPVWVRVDPPDIG
ncbi:primosomal protein N' [Streptomyces sp. AC563]|uniref:primosomal protein N' n=1 Tax=Streptomyces buecherae TaxID=2763006 RepID=UPI00164EBC6E|nr:primosomal protein N' [Streptomyces buecherae]MBC3992736.1 primosomal protein N' [Streptomyces buecherae]